MEMTHLTDTNGTDRTLPHFPPCLPLIHLNLILPNPNSCLLLIQLIHLNYLTSMLITNAIDTLEYYSTQASTSIPTSNKTATTDIPDSYSNQYSTTMFTTNTK
ncbi:unnamed protein product [Gordionus sp. m RMFG-2023]